MKLYESIVLIAVIFAVINLALGVAILAASLFDVEFGGGYTFWAPFIMFLLSTAVVMIIVYWARRTDNKN